MENINNAIDIHNNDQNIMLTTIDNPYNPFDHWDEWYLYDIEHGYDTCGLLARLLPDDSQQTDEEKEKAIDQTINEIVNNFPLNIYIKVNKDSIIRPISLSELNKDSN